MVSTTTSMTEEYKMTKEEAIEILDRIAHDSDSEVIKYPIKVAIKAFEMAIAALKDEPAKPGKWIPLTWDESKCESSYPDDMDGCWAIFTDGKNMSIERGKKDAIDHFFPSGRWFNMSDAVAWMPLHEPYKEGENK